MMLLLQVPSPSMSIFDPVSGPAARLASLGAFLLVISFLVFGLVMVLLAMGLRRGRGGSVDEPPLPHVEAKVVRRWVIGGGAVFSASVLAVVLVVVLATLRSSGAEAAQEADVELVGHRWWWEVRYPALGIVSANEIHIPTDSAVRIKVRSADVIHSLWVPQLQGKMDLIPGKENEVRISATRAGIYRGECAEYCGAQHAHMELFIVAHEPAEYAAWMAARREPAVAPTDPLLQRGAALFQAHACVYCHTVRGTPARGRMGPDLTHVGARLSIAAGMLPTTQGALAGWIANPGRIKPGTLMPGFAIAGEDLRAIAAYLESLE